MQVQAFISAWVSSCTKFPGIFFSCPSITAEGEKRGEFRMCCCVLWLNGHSSWMWWMLGGRRCRRRGKRKRSEKKEERKGIEKKKSSREKNFISIFHIHFRDISIMDIFLMPRTCYMLMLMLFHLIFPFPTPLSFPTYIQEWVSGVYWNGTFVNRRKAAEGHCCWYCWTVIAVHIFYFIFFDVSFVKKIVISISIMLFTPSTE